MNRYEYLLSKIRGEKEKAIAEEKHCHLIKAFILIEKCFEKQKNSVFKVTVPYIPYGVYGKKYMKKYNKEHNKKIRFKNIKYRYVTRYSIEGAAKLCGFYIIDEINHYNSKNLKITYVLSNYIEQCK